MFINSEELSSREQEWNNNLSDLMGGFQVDLLPEMRHKYFPASDDGMRILLTETGGQSSCFKVKKVERIVVEFNCPFDVPRRNKI